MEDSRNWGQTLRLGAGAVGLALLLVWLSLHFHFKESLEVLLRLNPGEVDFRQRADDQMEGSVLHFGVPLVVLGIEALVIALGPWLSEGLPKGRRDRLFKAKPRLRGQIPKDLPLVITSDIDACVTPEAREAVGLRNIHKLRQYCDFVQDHRLYPPFILVSARAQEYTELLCQTLGLIDGKRDVPCVLENGMAIYLPHARTVVEPAYVTAQMSNEMKAAREVLTEAFKAEYEFEPKRYMITINVERQRDSYCDDLFKRKQAVDDLRLKVETALRESEKVNHTTLSISSTINAVDIVPNHVSKLKGLEFVLEYVNTTYGKTHGKTIELKDVASIGNSEADGPLLQAVGKPFCAVGQADRTVKGIVSKRCTKNVLQESDSAAVVTMIERVTGLNLL